jgi:hypothetical protein
MTKFGSNMKMTAARELQSQLRAVFEGVFGCERVTPNDTIDLFGSIVPMKALYGTNRELTGISLDEEHRPDEGPLWHSSRVNIMSLMRNGWGRSRASRPLAPAHHRSIVATHVSSGGVATLHDT